VSDDLAFGIFCRFIILFFIMASLWSYKHNSMWRKIHKTEDRLEAEIADKNKRIVELGRQIATMQFERDEAIALLTPHDGKIRHPVEDSGEQGKARAEAQKENPVG
jgi:hypothetical protein